MTFSLRTTVTPLAARAILAGFALLPIAALPVAVAAQQRAVPAAPAASADDPAKKPTPRLADGHPDLNGFWAIGRGPDTPVGSGFGTRNANIKRGEARNAAAQYADPNQPPYKPELIEKVKDLAKNESRVDTAFFCKPGGVPRVGPPHSIVQAPGMPIVLLYEVSSGNTFRLVPTDGRPHDPNADLLYYGDAIGRWEGDTLVVDSIGFNDETWLGIYGWFHSDKMHVTERITRAGDTLRYQATVEDPEVFTKPWTMNPWVSVRTTKELILENPPCVETDIDHVTSFDEKTKQ
jgi:hypothetical protein